MTPTSPLSNLPRQQKRYAASVGKDLIAYVGEIDTNGYRELEKLILSRPSNAPRAILSLATNGGYCEAAHKFVTLLQKFYPEGYELHAPRHCKSAGTFIALGARSLIMNRYKSELGPIDPQFARKNELASVNSGLAAGRVVDSVCRSSLAFCHEAIGRLLSDPSMPMSSEQAAQIAIQLSHNLFAPIVAKIDLNEYGDQALITKTVLDYGFRVIAKGQNCEMLTVEKLAMEYGSHSFVIDHEEARTLFHSVQHPDAKLDMIGDVLAEVWEVCQNSDTGDASTYISLASAPKRRPTIAGRSSDLAGSDRRGKHAAYNVH